MKRYCIWHDHKIVAEVETWAEVNAVLKTLPNAGYWHVYDTVIGASVADNGRRY